MKKNRNELMKILTAIKPGLAKKGLIEQTTHFIFTGEELITFNDQICIMHPYNTTNITFSVKAEEFYKVLNGITDEEIELELTEKELMIKAEQTEAGISVLVADKDKIEPIIEQLKKEMKTWTKLPKDFVTGIFLSIFSTARDMTMGVLSCISIDKDRICSTDSLRASWYSLSQTLPPFLMHFRDAAELVKFPIIEYCLTDNWVHFRTEDDVTFSCRRMAGEYAEIEHIFEVEGVEVKLPDALREAVSGIAFLAEGDIDISKSIEMKIEKGKIECKAKKEVGWAKKSVKTDYAGKTIKFLINPIFLAQILDKSTDMTISAERALFVNENFYHVMSLPIED